MSEKVPEFDAFVETIAALRAPDGCPWDKEQTHKSIAKNMIEEAYEAIDAIEADDVPHMREELGDVLLQVVLQSQIAADEGQFTIHDVCREVNEKIIRRHPHVFGDAQVSQDANAVLDLWDQIKLQERAEKEQMAEADALATGGATASEVTAAGDAEASSAAAEQTIGNGAVAGGMIPVSRERLLDAVPKSFPALMQAQKISRKAAAAGFEWETIDDIWDKVAEEIDELKAAYDAAPKSENGKIVEAADSPEKQAAELELGDVFFALVNVARRMGLDGETALRAANEKFRRRWAYMEDRAWEQGADAADLTAEAREAYWEEAKKRQNQKKDE